MMGTVFKAHDMSAQETVRAFKNANVPEWPISQSSDHQLDVREERAGYQAETDPPSTAPISEVDELRKLLESAKRQLAEAEKQAYQRGLEEGKSIAVSRDQDRLDLLKANALEAQNQLDAHLSGLQALSLQLAQIALSKIFGNAEQFADFVAASIRYRCDQLSSELITGIRVSPEDFPSQEALEAVLQVTRRTDIAIDARLASGECLIDLKLGQYDIGIGSQWSKLQTFLADLSREELSA